MCFCIQESEHFFEKTIKNIVNTLLKESDVPLTVTCFRRMQYRGMLRNSVGRAFLDLEAAVVGPEAGCGSVPSRDNPHYDGSVRHPLLAML